jgi:hypothetical protein
MTQAGHLLIPFAKEEDTIHCNCGIELHHVPPRKASTNLPPYFTATAWIAL